MYNSTLRPEYQILEERKMAEIAKMAPEDPRVWAATGKCLLMPKNGRFTPERGELAIKTLQRAAQLAPRSAPCAFNMVTAHTHLGQSAMAEPYLQAVLNAETLACAEFLIGWIHAPREWWFHCSMWNRFLLAFAQKKTGLDILKAEAHIRLAGLQSRAERIEDALEHLALARDLDPENYSGVRLWADLLEKKEEFAQAANMLWKHRIQFHLDLDYHRGLTQKLLAVGDDFRIQALAGEARLITKAMTRE